MHSDGRDQIVVIRPIADDLHLTYTRFALISPCSRFRRYR